jgi:peptide/nickel transport system substrate-binding protein
MSLVSKAHYLKLILIIFFVSLISVFVFSNYCIAQEQGGTLTLIRSADSRFLDYGFSNVMEDMNVCSTIFDTLVEYDAEGNIVPGLATSWEPSEDGKTWIFHLRNNVKFHDGSDFDANAVVVSFTRQNEDSPYYYYPGRTSSFNIYLGEVVNSVEAVDSETVKIVLNQPFSPLLNYLAMQNAAIVSPTALEKYKENFSQHPVGTGPFVFKEWERDAYIKLDANKDYWGKVPYVDELIFRVVPDVSSRLLELQKGTVCIVQSLNPDQTIALEGNPNVVIAKRAASAIGYFAMNVTVEPLDNVLVRKAINYAIDTQTIIDTIMEGQVTRATTALPEWMPEHNENIPAYPYDPEKAKELLREAGYPDGFTTELWTFAFERSYLPNAVLVAQKIQADLQNVGIDAKLSVLESAIYWELVNTLKHQIAAKGWSTPPVADQLLRVAMLMEAGTGYGKTPRGQELIEKAKEAAETADEEKRIRIYKDIQQVLYEDTPVILICHPNNIWGYNAKIHNVEIPVNNDGSLLEHVWIEK